MAWITPVIGRENGQTRTTADDMNRIAGNLNFLTGGNLKANYTNMDIVTYQQWKRICDVAQKLNHYGLNIATKTDYVNFNNIEKVALYNEIVEPLRLSFKLENVLGANRL